jgi:hypothetical protein
MFGRMPSIREKAQYKIHIVTEIGARISNPCKNNRIKVREIRRTVM